MALEYLNIAVPYQQILQMLRITDTGAYFRNMHSLESLGVRIMIGRGSMEQLHELLGRDIPPLVFVNTGQLHSYWRETTNHVVVVVGMDQTNVFVNDPYFAESPKLVSLAEMELAWLEQDYLFAVIERQQ